MRRVAELERTSGQCDGTFVVTGGTGEIGCLPQTRRQLRLALGIRVAVPQLEDALQVGEAGRRSDQLGRVRRCEQRLERRRLVAATVEVECELTGAVGGGEPESGLRLQRGRDGSVETSPLGRQRRLVGDLADERMSNSICVRRRVHDQQASVHRGAHRRLDRRLIELDHRGQQLRIGVPADGGQRREHLSARRVKARDVSLDELREKGGDGVTGEVCGNDLLGEQRVALASSHELVHERWRRGEAQHRSGLHRYRVAIEAVELDALDATHAAELGDSTAQVRVANELVSTVGADEHDLFVDKAPGEMLEQVPGGGIRPLEIVEADDGGALRAQLADEPEGQDEHVAGSPCARCRQLAERLERGQLADLAPSLHLTEEIDQGSERDRLPADVNAATDVPRRASTSRGLRQQRGLPDAWITADEHDPWLTPSRPRHRALEHSELVVPSDDRVRNASASHGSCSIARRPNSRACGGGRRSLASTRRARTRNRRRWAGSVEPKTDDARSEGSRPMREHPP